MGKLIKSVFLDIFKLYKNFGHFTLSKILIFIAVFVMMIALAVPYLLIVFGFLVSLGFNGSLDYMTLLSNPYFFVGAIILGVIGIVLMSLAYSYSSILFFKLNLRYLDGKKLPYKKNYYINLKMIFAYTKVFLLNLLLLSLPFIIFMISFFILVSIFGGVEDTTIIAESGASNPFSVILLVITIICFITFIYLMYKTLFSYIVLVDESKGKKFKGPFYYIKRSFAITKGFSKAGKFVLLSILVMLFTSPVYIPEMMLGAKLEEQANYYNLKFSSENGPDVTDPYYTYLDLNYSELSKDDIISNISRGTNILYVLGFLEFLLVTGVFNMMITSLYRREFKK